MSVFLDNVRAEAIVFDFDGTFYSGEDVQNQIWTQVREKLVNSVVEDAKAEDIASYVDLAKTAGWKGAFLHLGGSEQQYHRVVQEAQPHIVLEFDPKLRQLLLELHQVAQLYIFTSATSSTLKPALEKLIQDGSSIFNNASLTVESMTQGFKPSRAAYIEMIERFQLEPSSTIYIDDQVTEVAVARELGLHTFLVSPGKRVDDDYQHRVLNSLTELRDHLVW